MSPTFCRPSSKAIRTPRSSFCRWCTMSCADWRRRNWHKSSRARLSRRRAYGIWKRHRTGGWKKATAALSRRIGGALLGMMRDRTSFSYDGYDFWRLPDVPDDPIAEMALGKFEKIIREHGYESSKNLVDDFHTGKLAEKKGVGSKCQEQIKLWIQNAARRGSGSEVRSSGAPVKPLGLKTRKLSHTEFLRMGTSSTSTNG